MDEEEKWQKHDFSSTEQIGHGSDTQTLYYRSVKLPKDNLGSWQITMLISSIA